MIELLYGIGGAHAGNLASFIQVSLNKSWAAAAEDVKRIIAASKAPYDTIWRLVAETGIRRGETCGLNVGDVDLANRVITVRRSVSLTVDDQSLTEVLRKHFKLAGRDIVVNEPVKRLDGSRGIVDLMLSRRVPSNREDELEHLVIELKAPSVKIGMQETQQVKSYAFAVQKVERFRGIPTRWAFWLVSNDMDDYATAEVHLRDKPEGVLWDAEEPRTRIWVKTWAQIIHGCRTRLRIFQNELNHSADRDASLEYLRETYARVLQGVEIEEPQPGGSDTEDTTAAKDVTLSS